MTFVAVACESFTCRVGQCNELEREGEPIRVVCDCPTGAEGDFCQISKNAEAESCVFIYMAYFAFSQNVRW